MWLSSPRCRSDFARFALCCSRLLDMAQISFDLHRFTLCAIVALVSSMSLRFRSICSMWLSSPRCRSDFARFALCGSRLLDVALISLDLLYVQMWFSSPRCRSDFARFALCGSRLLELGNQNAVQLSKINLKISTQSSICRLRHMPTSLC